MSTQDFKAAATALFLALGLMVASAATASVVVDITATNTATATISITDANDIAYDAVVTIAFDNAVNLSADSLNLTATLIDPNNPPATLPAGVSVDPAFPMLISVEPPVVLFLNGFEANQTGNGGLAFYDTYQFEVHTADLSCSSMTSSYRLYKAPHGSTAFADITDGIYSGSVRARGRGGAFSQFLIVRDTRLPLLVATEKLANLTARLLASTVNGGLLPTLTALLTTVGVDLLTNIAGAIAALDQFIQNVTAAAGTDIANEWIAGGSLSNDAGELISLAETLRFTLTLLQGNPLCLPPSD
ncbi:MAG: hypothetical protein P4L92_14750 [Rudaea sp.]|nr:hypothetical protein [Rudaea sp.]